MGLRKNVLKGRENGKVNDERGRCEASAFFYGVSGLRSSIDLEDPPL